MARKDNRRGGRDKERGVIKKYCDRCDNLIESCICDEIDRPERRQHRRTTK